MVPTLVALCGVEDFATRKSCADAFCNILSNEAVHDQILRSQALPTLFKVFIPMCILIRVLARLSPCVVLICDEGKWVGGLTTGLRDDSNYNPFNPDELYPEPSP